MENKEINNVPKVYQAISAVQEEISKSGISKSRKNQQQGYIFRGIDEIYNTLAPIFAKHKLLVIPNVLSREQTERTTKRGEALFSVVVYTKFKFISAEDGSTVEAATYGEAMDTADKATNKAMSAAYKYVCLQTFSIPTAGDNDADATTHDVAPRKTATEANKELSEEDLTLINSCSSKEAMIQVCAGIKKKLGMDYYRAITIAYKNRLAELEK